jgi:hypothetical protein
MCNRIEAVTFFFRAFTRSHLGSAGGGQAVAALQASQSSFGSDDALIEKISKSNG